MTRRFLLLPLLLLIVLPAAAQTSRNEIAVSLGRSNLHQLGDPVTAGLSYNRFWASKFSTRLGVLAGRGDVRDDDGDQAFAAYHAIAEFHPLRGRVVSPYAGIGVVLAVHSIELTRFDFSKRESRLTGIAGGGIDWRVAPRFAVAAEVRYMHYDAELGNRFGYNVDPLIVVASAKLRY